MAGVIIPGQTPIAHMSGPLTNPVSFVINGSPLIVGGESHIQATARGILPSIIMSFPLRDFFQNVLGYMPENKDYLTEEQKDQMRAATDEWRKMVVSEALKMSEELLMEVHRYQQAVMQQAQAKSKPPTGIVIGK